MGRCCVLWISVPVKALCVERIERLSWMCPALRIITPEDQFFESVLTMDIDIDADAEMIDCFSLVYPHSFCPTSVPYVYATTPHPLQCPIS